MVKTIDMSNSAQKLEGRVCISSVLCVIPISDSLME